MNVVDNYRLKIGTQEYVPIMIGGMGVNISTAEMAWEASRLGGIGHISDAEVPLICDQLFKTEFVKAKAEANKEYINNPDKSKVKFIIKDLYDAQKMYVSHVMSKKTGSGAVYINIMEKLTMGDPPETMKARLAGAMDGGVDGITLSAGLHNHSLKMIESHPRFRDVKIGIIVSSARALKIFLRGAYRVNRLPDYIVVEGPLAGGHLGFGPDDWQVQKLDNIVVDVIQFLKNENLEIPIIAAGGIFTGKDGTDYLKMGAAGIQVATRFTVTKESGLPDATKQEYFKAEPSNVIVSCSSPTGYLIRMLNTSPSLTSTVKPCCEPYGYILDSNGECQYLSSYQKGEVTNCAGCEQPKTCLCYHFSKHTCNVCGHYVYRLKDTTNVKEDGSFQILTTEHVFKDYQFNGSGNVELPVAE